MVSNSYTMQLDTLNWQSIEWIVDTMSIPTGCHQVLDVFRQPLVFIDSPVRFELFRCSSGQAVVSGHYISEIHPEHLNMRK